MNILQHYLKISRSFVFLLVLYSSTATAQKIRGTIRGKVNDNKKEAVESASVMLKNTHYGAVTDDEGFFNFRAPAGNYTLVISLMGYQPQEMQVTVKSNETIDLKGIILLPAQSNLKEVQINTGIARYRTRHSNDVAKIPLDNLENP